MSLNPVNQTQYNKYATLKITKEIDKEEFKAFFYRTTAYATAVVGTLFFAISVACLTVPSLAELPFTVPSFFLSSGTINVISASFLSGGIFILAERIYTITVKNTFVRALMERAAEARQKAEVLEGYIEHIALIEGPDTPTKQLLGMAGYWRARHEETKTRMTDLKNQLDTLSRDENDYLSTYMEHHQLKEGEYLRSKIYAAYFTYLAKSPTDRRSIQEFVHFHPLSVVATYRHKETNTELAALGQATSHKPAYLTTQHGTEFSRKALAESNITALSEILFSRQIAS